MAYTTHVYTKFALSALTKKLDLSSDTIKAIALSAYTVGTTRDSAQFVSDVLAAPATESTGGTYTTGGITLSGVSLTESGHTYVLAASPIVFSTSSGINAAYILIADTTPGSNATDPVIEYWDLGGTQTILSITPDPTGLLIATAA